MKYLIEGILFAILFTFCLLIGYDLENASGRSANTRVAGHAGTIVQAQTAQYYLRSRLQTINLLLRLENDDATIRYSAAQLRNLAQANLRASGLVRGIWLDLALCNRASNTMSGVFNNQAVVLQSHSEILLTRAVVEFKAP